MVTAGKLLQETRIRKKLTLSEVANNTKIKVAFLTAIEKGEYTKLPSSSYARGFVKNYAEFLGIPARQIIPLFRREFDSSSTTRVLPSGFTKEREYLRPRNIRLRHTLLMVGVIVFVIVTYLFYQYRSVVLPPRLQIISPKDGQIVSQDIIITGKTDPAALLFVNNEQISVNEQGEFKKSMTLFTGKNTIIIRARNTYGKETVIEEHVVVKE